MENMKVKCTICNVEEVLDNKSLEELSNIINKYKMNADSYTYLLNKMRGKCLDSDEHSFIFDEEFMKQVQDIVNKDKLNREEIDKINKELDSLSRDYKAFEEKVIEVNMVISNKKGTLQNLYEYGSEIEQKIKKITGYSNIDIWKWEI